MSEYSYSAHHHPPPPGSCPPHGWGMPPSEGAQDWRGPPPGGYHHQLPPPLHHAGAGATGGGGPPPPLPHIRPQAPPVEPNPNLYIHNVPKDATEEELKDLFSTFGTVERIRLKVNQKIGPQALYAFVTFSSTNEAQLALQRLNGYDMRSRRLRIEFQRSREDDLRPPSHGGYDGGYENRGMPLAARGGRPDFARGSFERRKRNGFDSTGGGSYMDDSLQLGPPHVPARDGPDVGPVYKKARHFDQGPCFPHTDTLYERRHSEYHAPDGGSGAPGWETAPVAAPAPAEPITLFLCDLLRNVRPDLLAGFFSAGSPPVPPTPTSSVPLQQKGTTVTTVLSSATTSAPASNDYSTAPSQIQSQETAAAGRQDIPGSVVWKGSLVRNGRKKVPVDVCYMSGGPMDKFLTPELTLLNISHRSAWDDLLKKAIGAICFLRLSDTETLETGATVALTPQRADTSKKFLAEHVQYLTDKQRAGVVALPNNHHLYLIPPGTPLFDKFKGREMPQDPLTILGLFVTGPTASLSTTTVSTDQTSTTQSDAYTSPPPQMPSEGYTAPQPYRAHDAASQPSQQQPTYLSPPPQQQPPPPPQYGSRPTAQANALADLLANFLPRS